MVDHSISKNEFLEPEQTLVSQNNKVSIDRRFCQIIVCHLSSANVLSPISPKKVGQVNLKPRYTNKKLAKYYKCMYFVCFILKKE